MKSKRGEPDLTIAFVFVITIVALICGFCIGLSIEHTDNPCYAECRYSETYERCIAGEDLTIAQCHDIALESVD